MITETCHLPRAEQNQLQLLYTCVCRWRSVSDRHQIQECVRAVTYGAGNAQAALCYVRGPLREPNCHRSLAPRSVWKHMKQYTDCERYLSLFQRMRDEYE